MREIGERTPAPPVRQRETRAVIVARARLFVFLTMLVPLFSALQAVLEDGVPGVEIRIVPRDVTVEVPVDVVVERIIDRLVFVPVPTAMLHPWTRPFWDVSNWDLSRLLRPGSFSASAAVFGPTPARLSVRPSVFAQPNPAVAAGITVPGAPITRFGPAPGVLPGPNPFGPGPQFASILASPLAPLTTTMPASGSASAPAPLFTSVSSTSSSQPGNQRVDAGGSSIGTIDVAPGVVMPAGPLLPESPLPGSALAGGVAVASTPVVAGGPIVVPTTQTRQPPRERESPNDNASTTADSGRTRSGVPTGNGGTTQSPSTGPAPATRVPATPTPVPATRVPATPTPTPKPAGTKTLMPKPAATKTPTPKPAATKTPTPKPKSNSSSGSQSQGQDKNEGKKK